MTLFLKIMLAVFLAGVVLLGVAYAPISLARFEGYKDWIGIVGSIASIGSALAGFFYWLFGNKRQEKTGAGNGFKISMKAGGDMVGGNKTVTHHHNGKSKEKD